MTFNDFFLYTLGVMVLIMLGCMKWMLMSAVYDDIKERMKR